MKEVIIKYKDSKILELLKSLARFLDFTIDELDTPPRSKKKASDYKGILSKELTNKMQRNLEQSRKEWQHRI